MGVLGQLPRQEVFHYFELLTQIPHPSGHTKQISDAIVKFAGEHGLECRQDAADNVVIRKPASPGREKDPVVMMQGHIDMVPAAADGVDFDFTKEPLNIETDGKVIRAKGTTLGGDDGIAAAMMMAVLADDDISHPALECVFTSDEETGMEGAAALDMSDLRAKYLLNLDSENEGVIIVGCAGGLCGELSYPVRRANRSGTDIRVTVRGLLGGHSGECINMGRVNGCRLLAQFLLLSESQVRFSLVSLTAGTADNVIPDSADAVIRAEDDPDEAIRRLQMTADSLMKKWRGKEPDLAIAVTRGGEASGPAVPPETVPVCMKSVLDLPNGTQVVTGKAGHESVQTSLNLGIMNLTGDDLKLTVLIRSSEESDKNDLRRKITDLAQGAGGTAEFQGNYPGWPVKKDSPLQRTASRVWKQMTGKDLEIRSIHAGLECGIFASKMPGLDIISLGPAMSGIHTPKEELYVDSVVRIWDFLLEMLKALHG